jgi:hypothetical protein
VHNRSGRREALGGYLDFKEPICSDFLKIQIHFLKDIDFRGVIKIRKRE